MEGQSSWWCLSGLACDFHILCQGGCGASVTADEVTEVSVQGKQSFCAESELFSALGGRGSVTVAAH